jgi:trehalose 6-phosphate phosphatase
LDLAAAPDEVVVPPVLTPTLHRLRISLGGALALVSGRSLASLDIITHDPTLDAAGCHGGEFRVDGKIMPQFYQEMLFRSVAERLQEDLKDMPGVIIESKPLSVAFHYRNAALDAAQAHALVSDAVAHAEFPLRLLDGKKVVEILPEGIGKGAAIMRFMKGPPYAGRIPVFIGDDVTDEDGFVEVNRRNGISVRVGPSRETFARHRIGSVPEVLAWLSGPVIDSLEHQREHVR